MSRERLFLDTAFVQALFNPRDEYYNLANALFPRFLAASEVWVTELIFAEIGDALSRLNRNAAYDFINQCYSSKRSAVVGVDEALLRRALHIYHNRSDKTWGLTDCVSFVVMLENGLKDALTSDRHFVQAGFRALLLEAS